jgi:hypothetical protein
MMIASGGALGETPSFRRRGMRRLGIMAVLALVVVLAGCASESVYTLNGRKIAISGGQSLTIPKGFTAVVAGSGMEVTLDGDEEITINGRKFRAYSNKIEVNGDSYTVGPNQVLVVTSEGITIRGAGRKKEGN